MGAKRSWWQKIKIHPVLAVLIALLAVLVIVLVILGGYQFNWDWTGFNHPSKTLWDWLQLFGVLAVPVVVGFGAVWFTTRQGKVADAENKDNQRETALQAYIDKMSELLLHEKLRDSAEDDEARKIARVRTITVLTQLDARRIGYVFTFLREAGLMSETSHNNVVSLSGADLYGVNWSQANLGLSNLSYASLREANLSYASLNTANLYGADLSNANLSNVKFIYADLERVNLTNATVTEKQLAKAKSLYGATMPDGSIHE